MVDLTHDPITELTEIRNQLSYSKRIGFLFGAGTSKSMGIPDIGTLTAQIEKNLTDQGEEIQKIKESLDEDLRHVEGILNQIRLIRQLTQDKEDKEFDGITGKSAKDLDVSICNEIYSIISGSEEHCDPSPARSFVSWLNWISRDYSKEVFTTNYDLILEKAFEHLLIPFYDGFVGSHEPFFAHESLDSKARYDRPPLSWIRLWKLHGSLGWFWKVHEDPANSRVIRLSAGSKELYPESELVIYPSRDKYESSRKQPFIGYFDRLKEFLLQGEGIFIVSGYSFSDEHINEILFNGLNQNNRLHLIAFFYSDQAIQKIVSDSKNPPNMTMIGPGQASISGNFGQWAIPDDDTHWTSRYWEDGKIKLGDFKELVKFFSAATGIKE